MSALRPYQERCVEAILSSVSRPGNDIAVLPTAAGKSHIIAELARRLKQPILIFQPSKELVEQNAEKLARYVPQEEIGIFSASKNSREIRTYTFATIGTARSATELFRHFKIILADECHTISPKDTESMYMSFIASIGHPKVIGLTATPYRMDKFYKTNMWSGWDAYATTKILTRMRGKREHPFWSRIVFNISPEELLKDNYLCPLRYYDNSKIKQEDIPLNASMSDFNLEAWEKILKNEEGHILEAIERAKKARASILVFNSSVTQAERMSQALPDSAVVSAKTPAKEREKIIQDFKTGVIRVVFNVGVLTTGFDHPSLSCIFLCRPTRSIGLYTQMLGRGMRLSEGKMECIVVDYTGTLRELGRAESVRLVKRRNWELESSTRDNWHGVPLYNFSKFI